MIDKGHIEQNKDKNSLREKQIERTTCVKNKIKNISINGDKNNNIDKKVNEYVDLDDTSIFEN